MAGRFDRIRSGAWTVVQEVRREDVTFMAASIAYHAFVSMLPILLLLTIVVSTFGSEALVDTVVDLTAAVLPQTGRELVTEALRDATGGVGLSVVGVVVLLWGTSKIFRAMDAAFAEIYDTERELSLLEQFKDGLVVVLAIGGAAISAIVLGASVALPQPLLDAPLLTRLLAVLGLTVALFPVYYVFPDVELSVGEVIPGVVVAAVGWVGLEWLFNLYVTFSSKPDVFGLLGSLVLLVTWLYVGGLILLVGAAVNATLAGRTVEGRTGGHEKRQFGRRIADANDFDERVDELVVRARNADVPDAEIRTVLARRAGETDGGRRAGTDDEPAGAAAGGHAEDGGRTEAAERR